ncbi:MAG: YlbF family regulator [Erysipelotrichaceae bacterium]|nr:YlbF family regulator [Erysipelotrichaceae bacterium]MDD3809960.1 YlbF family regulator [Erysipelotrichaceae bacterium]
MRELAHQVNRDLLSHPLVKEYQALEKAYNDNEYLQRLEKKIVAIQKEIVIVKSKKGSALELVKEYENIKEEFAGHPVAVNYQVAREELNDFLQELNKYINNQLILDKEAGIA